MSLRGNSKNHTAAPPRRDYGIGACSARCAREYMFSDGYGSDEEEMDNDDDGVAAAAPRRGSKKPKKK